MIILLSAIRDDCHASRALDLAQVLALAVLQESADCGRMFGGPQWQESACRYRGTEAHYISAPVPKWRAKHAQWLREIIGFTHGYFWLALFSRKLPAADSKPPIASAAFSRCLGR